MIKTFAEARLLVRDLQICTIFANAKTGLPSLWEHVDLPEKQEGEKGWGRKVSAIWSWKNRLPAEFPAEIFYGKIKGGFAVLMTIDYLRDTHFPTAYRPVEELGPLAGYIFEKVRNEPWETAALRAEVIAAYGCTKSQFDTALKNLQIALQIVRANNPEAELDTWLPFAEVYPHIMAAHLPPS